ncbi:uncharacterized protein LOC126885603 [Diabrotica virgifera virgifera]|uniref:Uncharacterized protein n=1 Tax=Diabrotica virgifera virgifera TaxID=50390 RepID=A0ABM5KD93_DIAVI|nr:uncharacterized protein LOC126885603 [Diabrotica virgifera virgifera]
MLEHNKTPKYLGVRLDRTLSYRYHCQDVKKKVSARNNIIRKLTNTKWGAQPHTLRTSALALCFSATEFGASVWANSAHAKNVDVALNETVRIISGCLKPTPIEEVYPIAGIAPPPIRRKVTSEVERKKQETDRRHPLYDHQTQPSRLRSRKSFLKTSRSIPEAPETRRIHLWQVSATATHFPPSEEMAAGHNLPYPTWKALNRLRTGVSRCASNLKKWGYQEDDTCDCGAVQTSRHLLSCTEMRETCTEQDLIINQMCQKFL